MEVLQSRRARRVAWILFILFICVVVLSVLFEHLGSLPPRAIADEAYYLRAAADQLRGQAAPFSLSRVTSVSPLYPFPPLFRWLLAAVLKVSGVSLVASRAFFSGIATVLVALIAWLAFRVAGKWAAVWSILGLLTLPVFWEYSRLVMPHSLVATFTLGSVVCLNEWHRSRRDRWLAGAIALAIAAVFQHYWAIYFALLLPFLARPWSHRRTWFTLLPITFLLLYWLRQYLRFGVSFIRDFREFFHWESSGGFLGQQTPARHFLHPFVALTDALIHQPFLLVGIFGLVCIRDRWLRRSLLIYTIVTALFVFRDRDFFQYPHLSVLIAPGFAIGYGVFIHRLLWQWLPWLVRRIALPKVQSPFLAAVQGIAVIVFFSLTTLTIAPMIARMLSPQWLRGSHHYQREVGTIVGWVENHYPSNRLVIAASDITWRIPNRTADFAWAYLRQHQYLPGELATPFHGLAWSTNDFDYAYSTALPDAALVIFERKQLAATQGLVYDPFVPVYRDILDHMTDWPIVLETNYYVVFQNPRIQPL